ncbi:hypothetical protein ANN_18619 [Periplaneta americana]|uniref:Transcription elongation factor 1 homolog n=1 Tax=Periplaneta americana TaxID=6978 RepID=A0ABQ8SQJ6_PERAM|nr:hypothetical protein ANN_18619 [Periplaneta americana]
MARRRIRDDDDDETTSRLLQTTTRRLRRDDETARHGKCDYNSLLISPPPASTQRWQTYPCSDFEAMGRRKSKRKPPPKRKAIEPLDIQFNCPFCNHEKSCDVKILLPKNLKVGIYKTVILPVVLYGCETWTLTLREEQRLRVFENKVLRKIFGAKRDEVEWRKLHNAELHALYSSPDIIRNIKSRHLTWAGHVACMGKSRNACSVSWETGGEKTFWGDQDVLSTKLASFIHQRILDLQRTRCSAGVTCCLFSLYRSLGYGTTSFDGEIIAISESLRNLLCHINKFKNAVILSDSKAAILSIVSKHTPSSQTAEITKMLSQLISLNKRIVFQWIPSHCGILGNENADALAKKSSTATYRPVTKSVYYSVKRFIKSST